MIDVSLSLSSSLAVSLSFCLLAFLFLSPSPPPFFFCLSLSVWLLSLWSQYLRPLCVCAGEDPRVPLQAQGRAQAGGGGGHQRQGPRPRQPQRQGTASEQEEEQEGGHLQPRVSLRLPQRDGRVLRNTRFGGDGGRPQPAVQRELWSSSFVALLLLVGC